MDVEKELFILDGIARVSDDARTENLFLPKEMTTKGPMSHPVRLTKKRKVIKKHEEKNR